MNERRTLIEGLKNTPTIDPKIEKDFVFKSKAPVADDGTAMPPAAATSPTAPIISYSPLSTRIRSDLATSLKRASLERQLAGLEPNTVKDILEQILEPWLKTNGYLQ